MGRICGPQNSMAFFSLGSITMLKMHKELLLHNYTTRCLGQMTSITHLSAFLGSGLGCLTSSVPAFVMPPSGGQQIGSTPINTKINEVTSDPAQIF